MSEPWKGQRAPRFLSTPVFQEVSRESFERHAATPDVSPDEYLDFRHRQLRRMLSGKKLIYLDTNHWINLRHVILSSPLERPGYREMLALLGALHEQQRICCPVSFFLFEELMKQSDPATRLKTAQLMDRFSGGVCFQFPLEMARSELRHFLLRSVARQSSEPKAWVWTKAGFFAGHLFPTGPALPPPRDSQVQKVWTDLMWAVRLEHIIEVVERQWPRLDFWDNYAAASNKDAIFYRTSKLRYSQILEREKALLLRGLLKEHLMEVSQEVWDEFPQCREPNIIQNIGQTDHSPFYFPSLQILAGINAADMLTKKVFNPNDMLDYRHAALAIHYCDVVCCDHPMATRLRNKPCEFGKVYGTEILGQSGEILDYLKGLAH